MSNDPLTNMESMIRWLYCLHQTSSHFEGAIIILHKSSCRASVDCRHDFAWSFIIEHIDEVIAIWWHVHINLMWELITTCILYVCPIFVMQNCIAIICFSISTLSCCSTLEIINICVFFDNLFSIVCDFYWFFDCIRG